MIKRLRIRFIVVSMLSLLLVLLLIMGTVNLLNYRKVVQEADETLLILQENGGIFPKKEGGKWMQEEPGPRPMSPELPYESRYFSVLLSSAGDVISADTGKIAAIDTETAVAFAQRLWQSGRTHGFISHYRYARQIGEEGVRFIFLDCGRSLDTFRSFLLASCVISLIGLLAVLGLIALFSKRIVRPVAESYEKQKRFITDAGHELKTPLTIIDADAAVLEMEVGESDWLRDIQAQTKRLAGLTSDLIYLSRMEEENQLRIIDFPLSDLAEETVRSFQAMAKLQGKRFTAEIEPMLSFHGDEKEIRQLLSILLDNALKYSEPEGWISFVLKRQEKKLLLSVENSTRAALPDRLEQLFDRFYRAEQSRNSQTGGYGLGLSIAKAIVQAHKGRIYALHSGKDALRIEVLLPQ